MAVVLDLCQLAALPEVVVAVLQSRCISQLALHRYRALHHYRAAKPPVAGGDAPLHAAAVLY